LGPIFAERAPTIGKGRWNVSFYGTFFDYDTLNGHSLHDVHVTALHDADVGGGFDPDQPSGVPIPGVRTGFELDKLDIAVNVNTSVRIFSPAVTYGVTDKLDVSALLPIVDVDMDVRSHYSLIVSPLNPRKDVHDTNVLNGAEPPNDHKHGSSTGIGDLVLGAKYQFLHGGPVELAGAVLGQFATGDEKNFLGTGDTLVRPFLVASHSFNSIGGSPISVTPHINLGYQYDINYADRSALEYVVGLDAGTRRISVAAELLGAHDQHGQDFVDASVGLKWNAYKRLVFTGNVILPVNDTGLRSDLITTLGVGVSF
jgi:Putative MetA-pathway of phenol degradation